MELVEPHNHLHLNQLVHQIQFLLAHVFVRKAKIQTAAQSRIANQETPQVQMKATRVYAPQAINPKDVLQPQVERLIARVPLKPLLALALKLNTLIIVSCSHANLVTIPVSQINTLAFAMGIIVRMAALPHLLQW